MEKNKKGSITIYGIMLATVIIILVLALAPVLRDFTRDARNETTNTDYQLVDGTVKSDSITTLGMNCSTTDSDFVKVACIAADLNLFYLIGGILFLVGSIITARIIFS